MDEISRSRGWDKGIPHGVLPMEQLVLSDKWARKMCLAQGPQCSDAGEALTFGPSVSSQALYH